MSKNTLSVITLKVFLLILSLLYNNKVFSQYASIITSYDLETLSEFELFFQNLRTINAFESLLRDHMDSEYKTFFGEDYFYIDSAKNESTDGRHCLIHILCIISNKLQGRVKDNLIRLKITKLTETKNESNTLIHEEILDLQNHGNLYYHPFYLTMNLKSGKYNIALTDLEDTQNFVNEWKQIDIFNSFEQGNQHFENKRYVDAINSYNKFLENDPQYQLAYYNKGLCFYHLLRYDSAISNFENTIEIKSDFFLAYYMKGLSYYEINNFTEASNNIRKAISLKMPIRLIDYEKILRIYEEIILMKLDLFNTYMDKGSLNFLFNIIDEAKKDYNKAIEINSKSADAYYNRGLINYQMAEQYKGQYEEFMKLAIEDFETAVELDHKEKEKLKKFIKKIKEKL